MTAAVPPNVLTVIPGEVAEQSTSWLLFAIRDNAEVGFQPAEARLTLYDKVSGLVINGWQDIDVLNNNGGTIDVNGDGIIELSPADNVALHPLRPREVHVAELVWVYNAGTGVGRAVVEFVVRNLVKVNSLSL